MNRKKYRIVLCILTAAVLAAGAVVIYYSDSLGRIGEKRPVWRPEPAVCGFFPGAARAPFACRAGFF